MIGQPNDLVNPVAEGTQSVMGAEPLAESVTEALPVVESVTTAAPVAESATAAVPLAGRAESVTAALPVVPPRPPHPCQIIFKGMDPTEAARVEVRAWLDRLGALTTPMIGGQVVIEAVDEGRREDRRYHVRMELTMPEGVVSVGPEHPSNGAHEDLYVAIRNAFRAARRQLESSIQAHVVAAAEIAAQQPLPLSAES